MRKQWFGDGYIIKATEGIFGVVTIKGPEDKVIRLRTYHTFIERIPGVLEGVVELDAEELAEAIAQLGYRQPATVRRKKPKPKRKLKVVVRRKKKKQKSQPPIQEESAAVQPEGVNEEASEDEARRLQVLGDLHNRYDTPFVTRAERARRK